MAKGTTKGSSGKSKNDPNNKTTVITFGRATAYECEHCDSQCNFGKRYLEIFNRTGSGIGVHCPKKKN